MSLCCSDMSDDTWRDTLCCSARRPLLPRRAAVPDDSTVRLCHLSSEESLNPAKLSIAPSTARQAAAAVEQRPANLFGGCESSASPAVSLLRLLVLACAA
eukprot:GHUV01041450.1.p1 GENE.GHUV01041450.1~~GHUV01041450.1.p1  ORF type:complete len:100 (-),score=38.29 GHUV01041450.1:425-724(-)